MTDMLPVMLLDSIGVARRVRMRVARSGIPEAGNGLFLCGEAGEGARLGRFSGSIEYVHESYDLCEDWALARRDTRQESRAMR